MIICSVGHLKEPSSTLLHYNAYYYYLRVFLAAISGINSLKRDIYDLLVSRYKFTAFIDINYVGVPLSGSSQSVRDTANATRVGGTLRPPVHHPETEPRPGGESNSVIVNRTARGDIHSELTVDLPVS